MNDVFRYSDCGSKCSPLGEVHWNGNNIKAVSKHDITPKEAVEFFMWVDGLLPQGWDSEPEIETRGSRIIITGWAD